MAKASKVEKSRMIAASITAAATLLRDKLKDSGDPHESAGSVVDLAAAIYGVASHNDWSSKQPVTADESLGPE
jgi:hypothetical protein